MSFGPVVAGRRGRFVITGGGEWAALMLDRAEADRLDPDAAAEGERHGALPDF